jgi:hypothetical protein
MSNRLTAYRGRSSLIWRDDQQATGGFPHLIQATQVSLDLSLPDGVRLELGLDQDPAAGSSGWIGYAGSPSRRLVLEANELELRLLHESADQPLNAPERQALEHSEDRDGDAVLSGRVGREKVSGHRVPRSGFYLDPGLDAPGELAAKLTRSRANNPVRRPPGGICSHPGGRARRNYGMRTILGSLLGAALLSLLLGVPTPAAAQAPAVMQAVAIEVDAVDQDAFLERLKGAQATYKRLGLPAFRVWAATLAGQGTGTIFVSIETPDDVTRAKNAAKLATDPEWQKWIDDIQKWGKTEVTSSSLFVEITPK